ncbi:unnamed protein product [Mytilus coruscus]|uniref:NCAM n=1 Tax=Mytilus coruscus TaxID=42192 RepID=A0A6J8BHR3_MYTCO|nr:unnamed protein product [Mytilus coruscus]
MTLRLVCIISSFLEITILCATDRIKTNIIYASKGGSAVLKCKVEPNSKSSLDKGNLNDKKMIKTLIVQADGEIINPAIPNMNRLKIVGNITKGDYNLQIQNVSSSDEGIYKCSQRVTGISVKEHRIVLKLKVKPKNVKILHSENGVIKGEEGKVLNLTCSVESGIPPETITWYNVSSRLKYGGQGNLTIRIKTTKFHHTKMYSCKIEADTLLTPIQKNITLDIKYKPFVYFNTSNPIIVTENNNMTLLCYSDGNPLVEEMQIEKEKNQALTHCRQSTCRFTIFKIKRADAGLYKCSARNAIGTADTVVKVNVTYPPSVAVTQDIGRAALQCNPDGNPPKYTFHSWEHQSKFGETIRALNGSKYLKLLSSGKKYQLNGIYICKVDNGVDDSNGSTVQLGETSVQLSEVHIIGSIITLQRYNLTKDDFTAYEFNVANKIGNATFSIELAAADKPEKPNIKEVFPGIGNLMVTWTSTFNGGKEQQFILEYKTVVASEWNAVSPIKDSSVNCCHHVIEHLFASTEYMIRIQAMNELGKSKFTKIRIVKTLPSKTDQSGITTTITGLVIVIVVVVTVLTISSLLYLRGYFIKTKFPSHSSIQDEELQDEMAVENYIYQSQGNTLENRNQQVQSDNRRSANRQTTPLLQSRIESPYQNHLTANSLQNEASLAVENNLYHSQTSSNLLGRMQHCDKSSVETCRNASRDNMLQNRLSHSNDNRSASV